jgi:hypothetical protein
MLLPAPMYQYPSALPCTASTVSRFSPIEPDFAHSAIMLCRRNSQKDVSLQKRQRGANDAHVCSTRYALMAAFRLQTRAGPQPCILNCAAAASISKAPPATFRIHRAVSNAPPNAKKCGAAICADNGLAKRASKC